MTRLSPGHARPASEFFAVALTALFTIATGCGGDARSRTQMAIELPFAVPLTSCPERSVIGATLEASLQVGGYEPCALNVDAVTLAVSGVCDNITIGIVRPLGLTYSVPNPATSDDVALAYIVSWVDLRKETLSASTTDVPVNLVPDVPVTPTSTAKLLTTNADVQGLRADADCATITDDVPLELCKAEAWAKGIFTKNPINFDIDIPADGVANIVEACNGTLFP